MSTQQSIVPFETFLCSKKVIRIPFSEVQIGTEFKMGCTVKGIKTQTVVTLETVIFSGVRLSYYEANFVHTGVNKGHLGWISPTQEVEIVPPKLEDS